MAKLCNFHLVLVAHKVYSYSAQCKYSVRLMREMPWSSLMQSQSFEKINTCIKIYFWKKNKHCTVYCKEQ